LDLNFLVKLIKKIIGVVGGFLSEFFPFLKILSFLNLVAHPSVDLPVDALEPCTQWRYHPRPPHFFNNKIFFKWTSGNLFKSSKNN